MGVNCMLSVGTYVSSVCVTPTSDFTGYWTVHAPSAESFLMAKRSTGVYMQLPA